MLVVRVLDMAPSFGILVFILLQTPSPIRAAPNSLSTIQVYPKIRLAWVCIRISKSYVRRMELSYPLLR